MEEEARSDTGNSGAVQAKPREIEAKDSVFKFLERLPSLVTADDSQRFLRATPKGVFVDQSFLNSVVQKYIDWFHKEVSGTGFLSPLKVVKKFFRIPNPPLYYLVESKQVLLGHLVRREIPNPQRFGLPYYLGTPDDARSTFNPRDPITAQLGIEVKMGRDGKEFSLASSGRTIRFGEATLKEFARIGRRSRGSDVASEIRSYALRDVLQSLAKSIQNSHPAKKEKPLLIPGGRVSERSTFLLSGSITFVCDSTGAVTACYDLGGRALFRFVRGEIVAMHRNSGHKRKGFDLLGIRDRDLALVNSKNSEFGIGAKAFEQFIRSTLHKPLEGQRFQRWYTIEDCLEEFSNLFRQSSQIERSKISHQLPRVNFRSPRFWVSRRWLFISNSRNRILYCIDLYSRAPAGNRSRSDGREHSRRRGRYSGRSR